MNLCRYSKSEVLDHLILASCPLSLNTTEAKKCPCRRREYNVQPGDLRVLACTFPTTWRGEPIRDAAAITRSIRVTRKTQKQERKLTAMVAENSHANRLEAETPAKSDKKPSANGPPSGTAVAVRKTNSLAFTRASLPEQLDFITKVGQMIYGSKMFGCVTPQQGMVFACACGGDLSKLLKLRETYHIIGGNLSMKAEAMLSKFVTASGGSYRIICRTPDKVAIELAKGKQKYLGEFTWAEALVEDYVYTTDANYGKVAKRLPDGSVNPKALKDNWSTPRRRMQMMWARVVSDSIGAFDATVRCGTYTADELGGDAPEIAEDALDVIDAEFEIVPEPTDGGTADDPPFTPADEPAPATEPEQPAEQPAPETTTELIVDPPQPPADAKKALLVRLAPLKKSLLSDEQYARLLDKYGVKSARDLEIEHLEKIVAGLEKRAHAKTVGDELSDWANRVAAGADAGK